MKKRIVFAIAVTALLPTCTVQAQNLFRTGRPVYARPGNVRTDDYAPTMSRNWNRPTVVSRYAESIGRTSGVYAARPATNVDFSDYDRLRLAWENYRQQALRYQQRHGSDTGLFDNDKEDNLPTRRCPTQQCPTQQCPTQQCPTQQVQDQDTNVLFGPERFSEPSYDDGFDSRNAADFPPRLPATLPPRDDSPYGQVPYRPSGATTTWRKPSQASGVDLLRTANRPVVDLIRWLSAAK